MRIVATADLHGHLPEIPACDLLLIAGDVCPLEDHSLEHQRWWLTEEFAPWLTGPRCRAERVVWIAGNHGRVLEFGGPPRRLRRVATYLLDESVDIEGLRIYGTPWSQKIGPWAFSLPERMSPDPRYPSRPKLDLEAAFAAIPAEVDIVLCHQPPYGALDAGWDGTRLGSKALWHRLRQVRPRLVVYGHVHESYGLLSRRWVDDQGNQHPVTFINASHVDLRYRPINPPIAIEL